MPNRTRRLLEAMLALHTGRSKEQIGADIERNKILDAPAALEYGLVDRIIPGARVGSPACDPR
ncbi:ATP-dependent Clp protease proteolytic subunit [Streptomyces sp. NPDC020607]|uniref:ATP-dependent Clp protease proteolytic subunit n=1 Tax=Streptomyces sp. NPDC020607 TaxID=3365082 RepID=UPI003787C426